MRNTDKTKPKPTILPRGRETNIGDQTVKGWNDPSMAELDWDRKPIERPSNRKAQATRLKQVIGTQRRQDKEAGLRDDVEYVLDYLIDEGFTDSYDSALVILETMSEQWLVDLIESAKEQSDKQIDKGVKTTYKAQNVLDNLHQGRSRGLERIDRRERDDRVKRMRSRLKTRRDDLFAERGRREDEKMAKLKKLLGMQ